MLESVYANESGISNSSALQLCQQTKQALANAVSGFYLGDPDVIWMGSWDPEPAGYITFGHSAEAYQGRLHIDPQIFHDATQPGPNQQGWSRALITLILHELRHLPPFNESHPNANSWVQQHGQPETPDRIAQMYANDYPFNLLHSQNPAEMCTKPY